MPNGHREVCGMFEEMISLFRAAKKIGIFAHENPDGDAMGSAYSLKLTLIAMGKQAEVFLTAHPDRAAYAMVRGKEMCGLSIEDCDLLAAVDCADSDRLGEYAPLFAKHPNTVAVDHHVTHHPFAGQTVVEDISSCSELMIKLYEEMGCPLTKDVAHNLYLGMVCDTGRFQYPGVTPKTLQRAASLIETGVDFAEISKRIFHTKTREYYALMRTALEQLQFYAEGKVCALYLSRENFEEAGLEESEAGGIVTLPSSMEGVAVGVYIREREPDVYKVSLRSNGLVNVAEIAAAFGGGGHVRASGYHVSGQTVSALMEELLGEIEKQWKEDKV